MFVGTGSDVGKSVINAGFCRLFLQDGYCPAPFKAQNMSLNSYATPEGLEIGRAQAMQAEACGIACSTAMNPVLLKPNCDQSSQVVLNGKPIGNLTAREFFMEGDRAMLFSEALKSYQKLSEKFNPIIIEGAGSISELNLRQKDIVNMRIAVATDADTYLIADIDKGGVFASVYGSIELLPENERKQIKGIIINKFRGDISLFAEGRTILKKLTKVPVVGIIPYFRDIYIDDEDSVVLDKKTGGNVHDKINIVVVHLNHMSNFTDFNLLEQIPEINLFYSDKSSDILNADIVIIPGSKNTIADLQILKEKGLDLAIKQAHKNNKSVLGVCGGFQMMGREITDPFGVESKVVKISGLNILPVSTALTREKTTEQCNFTFLENSEICQGYEIHMGETHGKIKSPLCHISAQKDDGYFLNNKTWGTYLHGIFDNFSIINDIIKNAGGKELNPFDLKDFKEKQYDKLADLIRKHVDMNYIYRNLNKTNS